jgi:hypothetical protein
MSDGRKPSSDPAAIGAAVAAVIAASDRDRSADLRDGFGWRLLEGNQAEKFWSAWRRDKAAMKAAGYEVRRGPIDGRYMVRLVPPLRIDEDGATVTERDGGFFVMDGAVDLAGPFQTNAAAWRWLDEHGDGGRDDTDRYNRIRVAFSER